MGGARSWCQNSGSQESSRCWMFPSASATSGLVPTVSCSCPPPTSGDPSRPAGATGRMLLSQAAAEALNAVHGFTAENI